MDRPAATTDANCIRCGLCLSVCPTYREHLSETASPRGRVILARKGLEGQLRLTPNLIEQMYSCMACMACTEIFDASLSLGGTLSGEHGIGVLKRPYLERALGPLSLEVQRRIKQALDPLGILNPGKMLPERAPTVEP